MTSASTFISSSIPVTKATQLFSTSVSTQSNRPFSNSKHTLQQHKQNANLMKCSIATSSPLSASSSSSSSSIPLPVPEHIACEQVLQSVISESLITIIKVYSKSCRSCMKIERPYMRLSQKYMDKGLRCYQVCSDDNVQLAQSLGVRGFPTFIFYKNGKRIDHFASNNSQVIEETIEDLL